MRIARGERQLRRQAHETSSSAGCEMRRFVRFNTMIGFKGALAGFWAQGCRSETEGGRVGEAGSSVLYVGREARRGKARQGYLTVVLNSVM